MFLLIENDITEKNYVEGGGAGARRDRTTDQRSFFKSGIV